MTATMTIDAPARAESLARIKGQIRLAKANGDRFRLKFWEDALGRFHAGYGLREAMEIAASCRWDTRVVADQPEPRYGIRMTLNNGWGVKRPAEWYWQGSSEA